MTWVYFSQLRALSERSAKAPALYTINNQTVTQITCQPYQSLHIELLYLLPAGSPLYLGNITMNLFSVSAQNLTPKGGLPPLLCQKHMELHHTIYSMQPLSRFCAHCPEGSQASLPFLGAHLRANFHAVPYPQRCELTPLSFSSFSVFKDNNKLFLAKYSVADLL